MFFFELINHSYEDLFMYGHNETLFWKITPLNRIADIFDGRRDPRENELQWADIQNDPFFVQYNEKAKPLPEKQKESRSIDHEQYRNKEILSHMRPNGNKTVIEALPKMTSSRAANIDSVDETTQSEEPRFIRF